MAVWTTTDLTQLISKCLEAIIRFDRQIIEDARKEFSPEIKTGFGIDGNDAVKEADFEAVRGSFELHPMVICIREHVEIKKQMAEALRIRLDKIGHSNA